MANSINENMIDAQNDQLEVSGRQQFTDIHCHCLPGLDDGPATTAESIVLCWLLAREGIGTVVATPHQFGRFKDSNTATKIRVAIHCLNKTLKNSDIPLNVLPGSELHVDERICRLLDDDEIMTLADGGKYILLELPHQVSIDITPLLADLASMGIQCIISHVERIAPFAAQPRTLAMWLDHCAHLQVTASSLVGDFGSKVQRAAWNILNSGWVALVATDSHDIQFRRPRMEAAFQLISARLGKDVAHRVCIENPLRVVEGLDIIPVSVHGLQEVER
jgi:protein-tyrosine phosphatase